jgi:hypothetical protein
LLNKANPQVLAALSSLNVNQDFLKVKEWLCESLDRLYADGATTKDETIVRWTQGAAQTVRDFLEKAESANDLLRKSR